MSKLDDLIRDALQGENHDVLRETEEMGWFALGLNLFKGKLGWVTWVVMVVQTVMFIAGAWAAWRFFQETEQLAALKWGISAAVLWIMGLNLKLSLMPQIQADRVIREIRRVELLLATRTDKT